jgi:hypothetical protein
MSKVFSAVQVQTHSKEGFTQRKEKRNSWDETAVCLAFDGRVGDFLPYLKRSALFN